ncbi:MAG: zinc-binding dehydrogenase [Clostridia bacterium]|nr:zinc-binding dehydrogenase [Clostridia bacterium]MBQ3058593.1 zinc-binding dehydrogenase [Clostridia bacterium]
MNNKRIVFSRPNVAELVDTCVKEPSADEVQVRLFVSTISSGTERANLMGSKTTSWKVPEAEQAVFPRYAGYSSAGVVLKVGENVKDIAVGDRVALSWSTHTHVLNINKSRVTKIGNIDFKDAALFHISIFPLAAIRKCRLEIGESAIVMGMGVLGLCALSLLKAAGAAPIIAVDPNPLKREKALKSGADFALDPFSPDFAETAKRITNGGAKVGIEVTGIGAGLDGILDCMARFGRVALLGCTRSSDFSIDYYRKVHGPGITLVGAHTDARPNADSSGGWWTQADDMQAVMKLHEMGRLKLSSLVDETHSPEKATEIYNRLCNDKTFPIVQFDWSVLK